MSMNRKLTDEQKNEMRKLYETGDWDVKMLAIKYEVSKTTAWNYLHDHPKGKKTTAKGHKCPHCGAVLPNARNMMFCCYCGTDIATPAQKAVKNLTRMLNDITLFYPAERRDFAVKTINDTIEILKGGN